MPQFVNVRDREKFPTLKAALQQLLPASPPRTVTRRHSYGGDQSAQVGALFLVPNFMRPTARYMAWYEDEPVVTRFQLLATQDPARVAKVVFLAEHAVLDDSPHFVRFDPSSPVRATIFPSGCALHAAGRLSANGRAVV